MVFWTVDLELRWMDLCTCETIN
jgi:hypothetical protein